MRAREVEVRTSLALTLTGTLSLSWLCAWCWWPTAYRCGYFYLVLYIETSWTLHIYNRMKGVSCVSLLAHGSVFYIAPPRRSPNSELWKAVSGEL